MRAFLLTVLFVIGPPAFVLFRIGRVNQKGEARGYVFAMLALFGALFWSALRDLIHFVDDPSIYRQSLASLAVSWIFCLPPGVTLAITFAKWRRLPARRPSRSATAPSSAPDQRSQ